MKDNFSRQADLYSKYRPTYPQELYDFILSHVSQRQIVWDCGTGNGQAARELAKYFEKVFATDISGKQIDNAYQAANIFYSIQPAEKTNFSDNTFDLITVSQALHWFQFDQFYNEVKRVAKPDAWIAVWMYGLLSISPEIDELVTVQFYKNLLGTYWDYERKFVDDNYTTIPFPFREVKTPRFSIHFEWMIDELQGYINTWSALQKFITANHFNPVDDLMKKVKSVTNNQTVKIVFPVHLRMGQIEK
jgi:ubiquinone/menaquinone biosynthesis C-methylase UbiE